MPRLSRVRSLVLLVLLVSCGAPATPAARQGRDSAQSTDYGHPAVLSRTEGEARVFQGRRPLWIKVDPLTLGSRSFTVGMEDLPPGDSIGVHKHLEEDEVVFVHRGAVRVTLGDSTREAQTGGMVFIPRGTWIGFHVMGSDTATIVFMFNTPGFEKCLRFLSAPLGTPFIPRQPGEVAAARKACHQVRRVDEVH